ncbi:hypothetical protein T4B_2411 [Trichinella pseudospiralis]|uniref:Uncharacterized protein n=1 Tax=Trichinella pseudospiralis TaxID=6337 RepID=A0A0V1J6H2_TRIPS|nr:hypothetical protein T4A_13639 [Trichinella pseudospiralis]KRZ30578.1 hypothetical protein T4B_2411 [Trichinella pseudospiralis]KRZ43691.1 hypothetical protein T4C_12529 [Trichinella pseudospiralis]
MSVTIYLKNKYFAFYFMFFLEFNFKDLSLKLIDSFYFSLTLKKPLVNASRCTNFMVTYMATRRCYDDCDLINFVLTHSSTFADHSLFSFLSVTVQSFSQSHLKFIDALGSFTMKKY